MKAIHYKGQNKFYLFDKPEEPVMHEWTPFSRQRELGLKYADELKANLLAGKEIINPEVAAKQQTEELWVRDGKILKPGDIFDCPDNIGFEELPARVARLLSRGGNHLKMPINGTVIRLFLKEPKTLTEHWGIRLERPSEYGDGVIGTEIAGPVSKNAFEDAIEWASKQEPSPVETQYELWRELYSELYFGEKFFSFLNRNKSKFTITRNEKL